ncbi:hypothetical protein LTR53_013595 [Teratosphaeriaceae sp. CCFEE 6253]|nr:hypothetical protein LTR53_013595 [Teratosphaeriaceae sp. CCFEE 6253]
MGTWNSTSPFDDASNNTSNDAVQPSSLSSQAFNSLASSRESAMPRKGDSGMLGYVAKTNDAAHSRPATSGPVDLRDLKLLVPKVEGHTARSRAQPQPTDRSHDAPTPEQLLGDQKPFFATDTSSIGRSPTTVDEWTAHKSDEGPKPCTTEGAIVNRGCSPLRWDEEYCTESDGDDDAGVKGVDPSPDKQLDALPGSRKNGQRKRTPHKANGSGLPYIKGDSYPPSTKSVPSVADIAESRCLPTRSNGMPPPEAGRRPDVQDLYSQNQAQQREARKRQERLARETRDQFQNPALMQPAAEHDAVDFTPFSKPAPANLAKRTQAQHRHSHATQQVPATAGRQSPSNNTARLGSSHRDNSTGLQRLATLDTDTAPANHARLAAATQIKDERSKSLQKVRQGETVEKGTTDLDPQRGQPADVAEAARNHRPHHSRRVHEQQQAEGLPHGLQAQPEEDEDLLHQQLDFDLPELYAMQYQELKALDFDNDPKASESAPPGETLNDQLLAASRAIDTERAKLLRSLNINQWEEAGDWFLGRFGELTTQLKAARQEKRTAARMFESEIERRDGEVGEKRRHTDDALRGMRANGAMILQGTPKKAKQGR